MNPQTGESPPPTVFVVANLKGGTTKTTSAAFLAHALARRGLSCFVIDADPPGSLLRWGDLGEWTLPVVGLPVKTLHTRIAALGRGYDAVVIDTPPLDEQAGIVYSALRAADVVVVPVSPTTMELDRLSPILAAVDEVAPLRATPAHTLVLLTRTVPRANSTAQARQVIEQAGIEVMTAEVPRREAYAQAFGSVPVVAEGDPYDLAVTEMLASTREPVTR